ncbi:MAG: restriction endonuclease subunit S [Prevotella sp.]|nr:restriction endonuclease subunit S [Prevotella sp.]
MKQVPIKDICEKGSSALKQKEVLSAGIYPVYGASGIVGYLDTYHQEHPYIGIVKDGSGIGRVDFYPEKTSLIGTLQYILPKKGYDIRYIGYCLQSLDLSKYKQGAAIPHIYFRDYGERIVNVSEDISEQQRIVTKLDEAFAEIDMIKAEAEKQLSEAKALFQKALSQAMTPKEGWKKKTLKDISVISGDYGLSVPSKPFNGVRYLRITDITDDGELNEEYVSANIDGEVKKEPLVEGDILFARTGATVGKTLVYKKTFGECLYAGYLIRYRLNPEIIIPKFMHYITHSQKYYDWVLLNQEAAAQPNISAKKYNLLEVLCPPLSEQQRIVEELDELSENVKEIEALNNKLTAECDAMKQALLRQVFE